MKNCPIFKSIAILFCVVLFFACQNNTTQFEHNPKKYHENINRAELAICDSNYTEAAKYYKEAFQYLKEPFGIDLRNSLQCGLLANDKGVIDYCIPKYKERDYQLLVNLVCEDTKMWNYCDSLYKNSPVTSKIDTAYRAFLRQLEIDDQKVRIEIPENMSYTEVNSISWRVDSINMRKFQKYIDSTGIFPSENIVGNSRNRAGSSILFDLILIHYTGYVGINNDYTHDRINLHLEERVLAGEFHPELYAYLWDMRGYAMSGKLNNHEDRTDNFGAMLKIIRETLKDTTTGQLFEKETLFLPQHTEEEIKTINKNRETIYLEPYEDFIKKAKYRISKMWDDDYYFSLTDDMLYYIIVD